MTFSVATGGKIMQEPEALRAYLYFYRKSPIGIGRKKEKAKETVNKAHPTETGGIMFFVAWERGETGKGQ